MLKIIKLILIAFLLTNIFISCESNAEVVDRSSDNTVEVDDYGCQKFYNLGRNYQRSRLWFEAIEFYQKAIACSTDYAEAYIAIGEVYEEIDSIEKAEEIWNQMIETLPEVIDGYTHYGSFLAKFERYEESEKMYLMAHSIDPENPTPILGLADVLTKIEKYEEAIPYLEEALLFVEDEDKIIAIKQRLAKCYVGVGTPERSAELLEEILLVYPEKMEIHEWLIEAYKSMNEWNKALEHMEVIIENDPSLTRTMQHATLLAVAGRTTEALSKFRSAISMGGGLSAYKQAITLLNRSGQTTTALNLAEEALGSYPSDGYLNMLVGNKYYAAAVGAYNNSDWDGAMNNADRAISYYSNAASSGTYAAQAQSKIESAQQLREAARLKKIY